MVKKMFLIYKVINNINNKIYVGFTGQQLKRRINQHKYRAKKLENLPFYNAINKYGFHNFEFIIIDKARIEKQIKLKEIKYIKLYNSRAPNGYNATNGGDGIVGNFTKGLKIKRNDGKLYKSLAAAARDNNCNYVSIRQVLLGNSLTVNGYSFVDVDGKYDKIRKLRRKIVNKYKKELKIKGQLRKKEILKRYKKRMAHKTSKYKGVSYCRNRKLSYKASIEKYGKTYFLGYFITEKEAALAYNAKAKELFGEFAKLNEVQ